MARRIQFWRSSFLILYLQYLLSSLAAIPAGLLAYALIKLGINEFISLSGAIISGLVIAGFVWTKFDKVLFAERQALIQSQTLVGSFYWQFQNIGSGACLAGTIAIVATSTTIASPTSTVEYKTLNQGCRTGTATLMQLPSKKE
jgi:hypothetical protein